MIVPTARLSPAYHVPESPPSVLYYPVSIQTAVLRTSRASGTPLREKRMMTLSRPIR